MSEEIEEEIEETWVKVKEKLREQKSSNPLGLSREYRRAVAEVYREFLHTLPAKSRRLWLMTMLPRRTKKYPYAIPRVLIPHFIEYVPSFFEDFQKLFAEQAVIQPFRRYPEVELRPAPRERFRTTLLLPDFEPATHYASSFYKHYVVPVLTKVAGADIHLLRGLDKHRIFGNSAIASDLIIGIGHGAPDFLTGQFLDVLWDKKVNIPEEQVMGKNIKLLSCSIGKELGPHLIEKGAKMFQGYAEDFLFFAEMISFRQYRQPWQDKTAEKFLLPVMEGTKALIEGATNKEAYDVEYNIRTKYIDLEEDPELKDLLIHDQNCFIMLGEDDEKI